MESKIKAYLAPMAGYTDLSFRELARLYGAEHTVTEMVSAVALVYGDKKTEELLKTSINDDRCVVQIFGNDPDTMSRACKILSDREFVAIDINMGCPAPKIVRSNQGSALIKSPNLVYEIVYACVKASTVPITVKFRKSFEDHLSIDAIKAAESAGASEITVHGRSRELYYRDFADWKYISHVADEIKIPVWGNGDIKSLEDALSKTLNSKIYGVAIGREAIGNPQIFKTDHQKEDILAEKFNTLDTHLKRSVELKGEKLALIEMRKIYPYYFKSMPDSKVFRNELNRMLNYDDVISLIEDYKTHLGL